jgi:hypothetical protein
MITKKNIMKILKKVEIQRMRIKLQNIIFCKLELNDEIENKQNFYKKIKTKNKK